MRDHYISRRVAGLKPSGIRKFFDIAATMKDVISLGIGEPDFTTPAADPARPASARCSAAKRTTPPMPASWNCARRWRRTWSGSTACSYDPANEMVITVGGSEALYLAMTALLDPGDEVIIPTPCFVSYQAEVHPGGRRAGGGSLPHGKQLRRRPGRHRAAITPRTKAILLGFPSNPTGAVASREALLEIARMAEEHDLIVISDEIYDRLVYGVQHVCFPALPGMRSAPCCWAASPRIMP